MTPGSFDAETVYQQLDVSRETFERLEEYVAILNKWQKSINLVSSNTLPKVWHRHILDSAQIFPYTGDADTQIMDIGSGAGLPGLILAIMRHGRWGDQAVPVTMVESDERKCAFLGVAAQKTGVTIKIKNSRLENLPPSYPDVITARALATVENLLDWTKPQHHSGLNCVFLKGANVEEELTCLQETPNIKVDKKQSLTSPDGVILCLSGFVD